jgi:hypothetical protein
VEFAVADDEAWLSVFGIAPQAEEASGEKWVREVRIPISATEELHVSWDVVERSVRVRWEQASRLIVDVYREQTTRLTVDDHNNEPLVLVEYHAGGCSGRTVVRTRPNFTMKDTFLQT